MLVLLHVPLSMIEPWTTNQKVSHALCAGLGQEVCIPEEIGGKRLVNKMDR
jgi:hypothetical protein